MIKTIQWNKFKPLQGVNLRLKIVIALAAATLTTAIVQVTKDDAPATPEPAATRSLPDFSAYDDVAEKKSAFFGFMKELTDKANRNVMAERKVAEGWDPAKAKTAEIDALLEKYRVDETDAAAQKAELLKRIQIIPPSLVLAQGANESAWGTSRFATEGYNFFGQWCFSKGCGLVPKLRANDAFHEVAKFGKPLESVESYVRNLNSHPTYAKLRDLRTAEMAKQGYPTGYNLAAGLEGYSERGMEYVEEIRKMIKFNKIDQLDVPAN